MRPGICRHIDNPNIEPFPMNQWRLDPIGLRVAFRNIYERCHLPLMLCENGLGVPDILTNDFKIHDDYRIDYLKSHIIAMKEAVKDGIPVIGYHVWTFMDVISTSEGFKKRYGLVYVNRDEKGGDLNRYKKDSFNWYREVIKENGRNL